MKTTTLKVHLDYCSLLDFFEAQMAAVFRMRDPKAAENSFHWIGRQREEVQMS